MPIIEYQCAKHHVTEVLTSSPRVTELCGKCGEVAIRTISAPRLPADGKYSYKQKEAS